MKNKFKSFRTFMDEGRRGEEYIYHTGLLAKDRRENDILNKVANNALDGYQRGSIDLFQRRVSKYICEYVARRTPQSGQRKFKGCYRQQKDAA